MRSRTIAWVVSLAAAGAAFAAPPAREVTRIDAAAVRVAFAKGMPLVEQDAFKVHASRRAAPGQAEIHARDTDVIYVLEGTATVVTGGSVVDGRNVAPDELRGASIEDGTERSIAPGDVVVIPNGVPHWFRDVPAPILYYVVKVTAPEPAR
jgi:glc operon protein GlcG